MQRKRGKSYRHAEKSKRKKKFSSERATFAIKTIQIFSKKTQKTEKTKRKIAEIHRNP